MSEDIQIGEVEGYRFFSVMGDELHSYSGGPNGLDYRYAPGANRARCDQVGKVTKTKVWVNNPEGEGLLEVAESESHGRIPDPTCGCGFWFYKSELLAKEKGPAGPFIPGLAQFIPTSSASPYGNFGPDPDEAGWVMGKVKGWGRTIEGTDGYRCEFVKVVALVTDDPNAAPIAKSYDVPVIAPTESLEGYILEADTPGEITIAVLPTFETTLLAIDDSVTLPPLEPAPLVTIGYELRGSMRWVTSMLTATTEEDDE